MKNHPLAAVMAGVPHRYPMLLLDRLVRVTPMRHGSAMKAVSGGEAHREGAVAGSNPGLPPSLIVDALGQLAIIVLAAGSAPLPSVWYLGAIESMTFTSPALPGQVLLMEATVQKTFRTSSKVAVRVSAHGNTVAEGVMVLSRGGAANEPGARPRRT